MEIYVCVPMEDGIVRGVRAFMTESCAKQAENTWLAANKLTENKRREEASDYNRHLRVWPEALSVPTMLCNGEGRYPTPGTHPLPCLADETFSSV